jgi:hypothetical protein
MSYFNHNTKFLTYYDVATDFKRCRTASKGRPIKGWCRLFKDGDDYSIRQRTGWGSNRGTVELCRIHPDNTVTFTMPLEELLRHTHTIVSSLWRVLPVTIERKRKGVYKIAGTNNQELQKSSRAYDWISNYAPEYFAGIKFDLLSGECLNAKPDMLDTIIPEMRKQWLRDLKRFKRGLKARAKVGALQGHIDAITQEITDGNQWSVRHEYETMLRTPKSVEHLLECMRTEQYPPEILRMFVGTVGLTWGQREITNQIVLSNVDNLFDKHSLTLRKAYGVFGETLHVKL